ncbi:Gfo/Idh/MocA family oxidoreductase [Kamptonema cortianum]|nr:Gfo/Idh/MocA family oxidoreductase [Oscillatoria laete-virens]MDK3155377.1 Gfo/Idh/MocA family oxidoreductase [Kamptonema cortianum]MDL5046126.1 Gfo/Idh/MocA family oxidoreductase [Oscillatoria amoena NRMC-F 0135]MDL5052826.1 Gfo/Idh/MocA family oxidoreductase [Oscillatoria laete-virens NRMC-F 0139]
MITNEHKHIRAAVAGVGRMGRRHCHILQSAGMELVGIFDAMEGSLNDVAQEHKLASSQCYMDFDRMLAEARPDLVVIATTGPTHAELTLRAANAGVSMILCEKPMAISLSQAESMLNACQASGSRLAINHQMRFMEQYTLPRTLMRQPEFGGVRSIHVAAGNFGLAMNGCHYFEMLRFLADSPIRFVNAWLSADAIPNPRGPQFQDHGGLVRLVTENGVRMTLDASTDQGHGVTALYTARLGQIWIDELAGEMYTAVRMQEHGSLPTTRYGMPAHREFRKITPADALTPTREAVSALIKGENYPSGEDGLAAVRALVALHVSHRENNRCVDLQTEALPKNEAFPWA